MENWILKKHCRFDIMDGMKGRWTVNNQGFFAFFLDRGGGYLSLGEGFVKGFDVGQKFCDKMVCLFWRCPLLGVFHY